MLEVASAIVENIVTKGWRKGEKGTEGEKVKGTEIKIDFYSL